MLSWVFGNKRKPSPEVYVAEETPEGFSRVTTTNPSYESPLPPYPTIPRPDGPGAYPYVAPYPPLPSPYPPTAGPYSSPASYPAPSPFAGPASNVKPPGSTVNPLDSIPFVLAPSLTAARNRSNAEVESIKRQTRQLQDKLKTNYNYDFSLETSVIQEICMTH